MGLFSSIGYLSINVIAAEINLSLSAAGNRAKGISVEFDFITWLYVLHIFPHTINHKPMSFSER
jgi:hypothetical protein